MFESVKCFVSQSFGVVWRASVFLPGKCCYKVLHQSKQGMFALKHDAGLQVSSEVQASAWRKTMFDSLERA
eukprot:3642313-Amphidinium_carterae.1